MSFLGAGSTTTKVVKTVTGVASKKVKSDIKELESSIKLIDKSLDDYYALTKKIDGVIGKIPSAWEGDAANAFVAKLKKNRKSVSQMLTLLTKIRSSAVRRKNKLEERNIWYKEINNAAGTVEKGLKAAKFVEKLF